MKFCMIHGIDNPACRCDPFMVSEGHVHIGDQPTEIPWLDAESTAIVAHKEDDITTVGTILSLAGWRVQTTTVLNFRAPLQRHARECIILYTNAPVKYVLLALQFVAGKST